MDQIAAARTFIETHGRDIDRARFAYHFDRGCLEDVLDALGSYQNADGGFGRRLEPDIGAPDSNPFAGELALLICVQAGAPNDHPVLRRAVAHLEETQEEDGTWRFTPAIYEHELAPWFAGWAWPDLKPSCVLAGLLSELGLGSSRLHDRVRKLFGELASPNDLLGDDYYAARPYAYYFLPESSDPARELYLSGVLWWLIRQNASGTLPDAAHFFEYVRSPHTFIGRLLPRDMRDAQLDRLESEQQEDGGWPSPYSEAWRPWTTVQNLLTLQSFGRLP